MYMRQQCYREEDIKSGNVQLNFNLRVRHQHSTTIIRLPIFEHNLASKFLLCHRWICMCA